jgi:hypothetical protein
MPAWLFSTFVSPGSGGVEEVVGGDKWAWNRSWRFNPLDIRNVRDRICRELAILAAVIKYGTNLCVGICFELL